MSHAFVKTLTGKTIALTKGPITTIHSLKERMQVIEGIPLQRTSKIVELWLIITLIKILHWIWF